MISESNKEAHIHAHTHTGTHVIFPHTLISLREDKSFLSTRNLAKLPVSNTSNYELCDILCDSLLLVPFYVFHREYN